MKKKKQFSLQLTRNRFIVQNSKQFLISPECDTCASKYTFYRYSKKKNLRFHRAFIWSLFWIICVVKQHFVQQHTYYINHVLAPKKCSRSVNDYNIDNYSDKKTKLKYDIQKIHSRDEGSFTEYCGQIVLVGVGSNPINLEWHWKM